MITPQNTTLSHIQQPLNTITSENNDTFDYFQNNNNLKNFEKLFCEAALRGDEAVAMRYVDSVDFNYLYEIQNEQSIYFTTPLLCALQGNLLQVALVLISRGAPIINTPWSMIETKGELFVQNALNSYPVTNLHFLDLLHFFALVKKWSYIDLLLQRLFSVPNEPRWLTAEILQFLYTKYITALPIIAHIDTPAKKIITYLDFSHCYSKTQSFVLNYPQTAHDIKEFLEFCAGLSNSAQWFTAQFQVQILIGATDQTKEVIATAIFFKNRDFNFFAAIAIIDILIEQNIFFRGNNFAGKSAYNWLNDKLSGTLYNDLTKLPERKNAYHYFIGLLEDKDKTTSCKAALLVFATRILEFNKSITVLEKENMLFASIWNNDLELAQFLIQKIEVLHFKTSLIPALIKAIENGKEWKDIVYSLLKYKSILYGVDTNGISVTTHLDKFLGKEAVDGYFASWDLTHPETLPLITHLLKTDRHALACAWARQLKSQLHIFSPLSERHALFSAVARGESEELANELFPYINPIYETEMWRHPLFAVIHGKLSSFIIKFAMKLNFSIVGPEGKSAIELLVETMPETALSLYIGNKTHLHSLFVQYIIDTDSVAAQDFALRIAAEEPLSTSEAFERALFKNSTSAVEKALILSQETLLLECTTPQEKFNKFEKLAAIWPIQHPYTENFILDFVQIGTPNSIAQLFHKLCMTRSTLPVWAQRENIFSSLFINALDIKNAFLALLLLQFNPKLIQTVPFPISYAIDKGLPFEFIVTLINTYGAKISDKDQRGIMAIHTILYAYSINMETFLKNLTVPVTEDIFNLLEHCLVFQKDAAPCVLGYIEKTMNLNTVSITAERATKLFHTCARERSEFPSMFIDYVDPCMIINNTTALSLSIKHKWRQYVSPFLRKKTTHTVLDLVTIKSKLTAAKTKTPLVKDILSNWNVRNDTTSDIIDHLITIGDVTSAKKLIIESRKIHTITSKTEQLWMHNASCVIPLFTKALALSQDDCTTNLASLLDRTWKYNDNKTLIEFLIEQNKPDLVESLVMNGFSITEQSSKGAVLYDLYEKTFGKSRAFTLQFQYLLESPGSTATKIVESAKAKCATLVNFLCTRQINTLLEKDPTDQNRTVYDCAKAELGISWAQDFFTSEVNSCQFENGKIEQLCKVMGHLKKLPLPSHVLWKFFITALRSNEALAIKELLPLINLKEMINGKSFLRSLVDQNVPERIINQVLLLDLYQFSTLQAEGNTLFDFLLSRDLLNMSSFALAKYLQYLGIPPQIMSGFKTTSALLTYLKSTQFHGTDLPLTTLISIAYLTRALQKLEIYFASTVRPEAKLEKLEECVRLLGIDYRTSLVRAAFKINKDHYSYQLLSTHIPPKKEGESIAQLTELYTDYCIENKPTECATLKEYQNKVMQKIAYLATPPANTEALIWFYNTIENCVCFVIRQYREKALQQVAKSTQFKDTTSPQNTPKEISDRLKIIASEGKGKEQEDAVELIKQIRYTLTELINAASFCGTRIFAEANNQYMYAVSGKVGTLQDKVFWHLAQRREELVKSLFPNHTRDGMHVHYVSQFIRMYGKDFGIPGWESYQRTIDRTFDVTRHMQELINARTQFITSSENTADLIMSIHDFFSEGDHFDALISYLKENHPKKEWSLTTSNRLKKQVENMIAADATQKNAIDTPSLENAPKTTTLTREISEAVRKKIETLLTKEPYCMTLLESDLTTVDTINKAIDDAASGGDLFLAASTISQKGKRAFSLHSVIFALIKMGILK